MVNTNKAGLVFGALLGGFHAGWALLVLSGYAQAIYDFILWAHMVHLPIVIGPFNATAAGVLIVMTALIGYVGGCIGAWVWNRVHR